MANAYSKTYIPVKRQLDDVISDAVRKWALGPDWRNTASAWPLTAVGGENAPQHWPKNKTLARRKANVITVRKNSQDWAASIFCDSKGKVTVAVPKGTPVVEVDE